MPVAQPFGFFRPRQNHPCDAFGQHVAEFGNPRFEKFRNDHSVASRSAGLGPNPGKAFGTGFGLGDPDHVLERHPDGEMFRDRRQNIDIAADVGIGRGRATVWTCDLTHGYIDINADYRT